MKTNLKTPTGLLCLASLTLTLVPALMFVPLAVAECDWINNGINVTVGNYNCEDNRRYGYCDQGTGAGAAAGAGGGASGQADAGAGASTNCTNSSGGGSGSGDGGKTPGLRHLDDVFVIDPATPEPRALRFLPDALDHDIGTPYSVDVGHYLQALA